VSRAEPLQEALDRYGKPEIFSTDQGVQFTCEAFIRTLFPQGIRISHRIAERDPFGSLWTAKGAVSITFSVSACGAA
jgi:hypothetical protein